MAGAFPDDDERAFIGKLEKLRLLAGLSRTRLSKRSYEIVRSGEFSHVSGFSKAAVSNWVNGDFPSTSEYVRAWAAACGAEDPEAWGRAHADLLAARRDGDESSAIQGDLSSARLSADDARAFRGDAAPARRRWWSRRAAVVMALSITAAAGVAAMIVAIAVSPDERADANGGVDVTAAIAALRSAEPCAENLPSGPAGLPARAFEPGPSGAARPDRLIELRFADEPGRGWIAWATLARSASEQDRFWLDWSYLPAPRRGETNQWRQCGPHPITGGPTSPAVQADDAAGRPRWFRACGQAPPADRPPSSTAKSFCTGWSRPG